MFGGYEEWEQFVERLVALGLADEITRVWWDVRPHPRFGTLEIRVADQPTRLETTGALAALLQAMVARLVEVGPANRGLYAQNRWAALRFGHEAELVHPDGSRLVSVLRAARPSWPSASAASSSHRRADQAGEQLEVGRADGLESVCRRLVELT